MEAQDTEAITRPLDHAFAPQHEANDVAAPADIKRTLERIGARYLADLRTLSDEFSQFYGAQLGAKDEQIAELTRRLEAAEEERDSAEARAQELKDASARYVAQLRTVYEELSRQLEVADASATQAS